MKFFKSPVILALGSVFVLAAGCIGPTPIDSQSAHVVSDLRIDADASGALVGYRSGLYTIPQVGDEVLQSVALTTQLVHVDETIAVDTLRANGVAPALELLDVAVSGGHLWLLTAQPDTGVNSVSLFFDRYEEGSSLRTTPSTSFGSMVHNSKSGVTLALLNSQTSFYDVLDATPDAAGVPKVTVRGWDPQGKKAIQGRAALANLADGFAIAYPVQDTTEVAYTNVSNNSTRGGSVNMNSQTSSTRIWSDGARVRLYSNDPYSEDTCRIWNGRTTTDYTTPAASCRAVAFDSTGRVVIMLVKGDGVSLIREGADGTTAFSAPVAVATANPPARGAQCALKIEGKRAHMAWTNVGDDGHASVVEYRSFEAGVIVTAKTWDESVL